ncbi:MAG TPA: hypothetical protein VGI81_26285 [Tepidisphaeraceae bacterium]|jgi:hypothetical protein
MATPAKDEIPIHVRNRIGHALAAAVQPHGSVQGILHEAANHAYGKYGTLDADPRLKEWDVAGQQHFVNCDAAEFVQFLAFMFRSQYYTGQQRGVDAVNEILREEGIPYEFTPYVMTRLELPDLDPWGKRRTRVDFRFPEAVRTTNNVIHTETVMPALQLLSGPLWKVANEEMQKAHEHLRDGDFPDAITSAGRSLESVLQIICDEKNYAFTPDQDTLNALLQACYKGGLFTAPYLDVIQQSSGKVRNKFGGHGKAMSQYGPATADLAEHMIQITSAHVLLLAKLSGL